MRHVMTICIRVDQQGGRGSTKAYLQGAEASKEKTTASLVGSSAEGASRSVFFCRLTALRMVEVWDSSCAGCAGLWPPGGGAYTKSQSPQQVVAFESEPCPYGCQASARREGF